MNLKREALPKKIGTVDTKKKKKKIAPKFLSCFYKLYPLQITENVEKKDKRQTDWKKSSA